MVSEREEKNPIVCCGQIIETDFCPHCGNPHLHIKFPHQFNVYLHNDDSYDIDIMLEKLNITKNDEIYDAIRGCAYEVKLEYEITAIDGEVNLIAVNDQPLTKKE